MLKRILYITIGIIIIGTIIWTFYFLYQKSNKPKDDFELVKMEKRDIYKKTVITGSVIPRKEVLIKPKVSGIIAKLYKLPGEYIRRNEIIGLIKIIPNTVQLNEAYLRVEQAEVNLKNVQADFERTQKLYKEKLAPQSQFITSQTNFKNAQLELDAAKSNLRIIKEGSASNKGAINTQIIATISGTILDIPVKEGTVVIESNTFNEGTTIASIADMSNLIFEGKVDESEVSKLKPNIPLDINIGAIDTKTYKAILEYVAPKGTDENGTIYFTIKAAMRLNKNEKIKVGYSATAEVVLEKKLQTMSIPESCVEYIADSSFVYLYDSTQLDNPYKKHSVDLGTSDGIYVELLKGIDSTDRIRGKKK